MGDERLGALRAVAHPLRLQMLSMLTAEEMSAAEVARELGISHANASYHLRRLHETGHIVVVGEERIRGGVAKRYRYVVGQPAPAGRKAGRASTPADLLAYADALTAELKRRLVAAESPRRQFHSDIETWVAPHVWAEVVELLQRASRLVHEQAQPRGTAGTRHVSMTAWAFPMLDGRSAGPERSRSRQVEQ